MCDGGLRAQFARSSTRADAVDVYNAWYDNGTPYSNVATQGTRNPAGDNLCVAHGRRIRNVASASLPGCWFVGACLH